MRRESHGVYPNEEAIRRRTRYERRRTQRQILRQQEEASRRNETKAFVAVMSGFLGGGVALSVMLRIGESMPSSVVYGLMIGVAVDLLFLIAIAALERYNGAYAYDYDCFDEEDGEYADEGGDDFAGLGGDVDASGMFRRDEEGPRGANAPDALGKPQRHAMPELPDGRSQRDMRDFLDTLPNNVGPGQGDVIVR